MKRLATSIVVLLIGVIVPIGALLMTPGQTEAQATVPLLGFPDADPTSGRFITVFRGIATLGDVGTNQNVFNVSLQVPKDLTSFELRIFDGDLGGLWDVHEPGTPDTQTFRLFRDPNLIGNTAGADQIYSISGTDPAMVDNDWFTVTLPQDPGAYNATRDAYFYHLVADWDSNNLANEQNSFKVAVTGQPFLLAGSTVGFQAFDEPHPSSLPTTYDGSLTFQFFVPTPIDVFEIYDGDWDSAGDSDDSNSPACTPPGGTTYGGCGFPPFQVSPNTEPEGARTGVPADNNDAFPVAVRGGNVTYSISSPDFGWTEENTDPSGNSEWEIFRLMTPAGVAAIPGGSGPEAQPDNTVPELPAGLYTVRVNGLDLTNNVFIHSLYEVYPVPPCDEPCADVGTGTPGYWKNHPEAWPVLVVTVLDTTYNQDEAIPLMQAPTKKDKTYNMFEQLIAAKLNVLIGAESSCILDTIAAAEAWLDANGGVGSDVRAKSAAWQTEGSALHTTLDDYNNGRLCAPHRD